MKKVLVLGAGMVGRAIAKDLSSKYTVSIADINDQSLGYFKNTQVKTIKSDLSQEAVLHKLVKDYDLIIGAVPGFMGFKTLESVIKAGRNIVDISFFEEDPFLLDQLAKENGVTAIMDCGVAPGFSNLALGYHNEQMQVTDFHCYVGGLPKKRKWPFEYKAPFSPIDVIEEYTRPARLVENGVLVTKEALSEPEIIHLSEIGSLEAFNTDGLRSLIHTMPHIPNMKEKTMRYPGHIDIMRILRETGFFSKAKLRVSNTEIAPLDLSSQLLFQEWKLGEKEEEFTVMRIQIIGKKEGQKKVITYDLFDEYHHKTETSSMARTTGYTCSAAARLVLENKFSDVGVFPPELVGKYATCFEQILSDLKEREIQIFFNEN